MAPANSLTCLTVLTEVHIEMLFELLLCSRAAGEAHSALLALRWQSIVEEIDDWRLLPSRKMRLVPNVHRPKADIHTL